MKVSVSHGKRPFISVVNVRQKVGARLGVIFVKAILFSDNLHEKNINLANLREGELKCTLSSGLFCLVGITRNNVSGTFSHQNICLVKVLICNSGSCALLLLGQWPVSRKWQFLAVVLTLPLIQCQMHCSFTVRM